MGEKYHEKVWSECYLWDLDRRSRMRLGVTWARYSSGRFSASSVKSLSPVALSIVESETSAHSTKRESSGATSGAAIVADELDSIVSSICRLNSSVCAGCSEAAMERNILSMAAVC